MTPADLSPAYKVTGKILKSYKNSLLKYISEGSREDSSKHEESSTSKPKSKQIQPNVVEEYNNFGEARKSHSVNSNYEGNSRSVVDTILLNKNSIIEILGKNGSNEEKQIMLSKLLGEIDSIHPHNEDGKSAKDNHSSSAIVDHTKSMGIGNESHDSLLCDDEAPNRNIKDKMESHSFHKRPLSQNNVVRSKSSRQKRRKKTPVHNNNFKHSLVSNTGNSNSKVTQDVSETDYTRSKRLIDDSKFGNKKAVVNAS